MNKHNYDNNYNNNVVSFFMTRNDAKKYHIKMEGNYYVLCGNRGATKLFEPNNNRYDKPKNFYCCPECEKLYKKRIEPKWENKKIDYLDSYAIEGKKPINSTEPPESILKFNPLQKMCFLLD